jgi:hypothetical protein
MPLDDIFDLQNNVCGCGIEHRFNAPEHLAKLFPSPEETSRVESSRVESSRVESRQSREAS